MVELKKPPNLREVFKKYDASLFSIKEVEKGLSKLQELVKEVNKQHPELNLMLEAKLKKEQSLLSKFKKFLGIGYE